MADKAERRPFDPVGKVGAHFTEQALKRGLICRALGDTIALCPPLIISVEEVDFLLEKVSQTLDATMGFSPVA
jgi:4-aminobutyrate---pyruvate transaminase